MSWTEPSDMNTDTVYSIVARVEPGEDGETKLTLDVDYEGRVPYFWWVFDGMTKTSVAERMVRFAKRIEAELVGAEPPPEPKKPWWSPPSKLNSDQVRTLATLALLMGLAEYASSLLTQTIDFVAKTYDANDAQLGVLTAVTRAGNLIVLVGGLLADRIGRRRLLLWTIGLVMIATAASAAAPNLIAFGAMQIIVNGGTNLALLVGLIAAVEEAPESSRAYLIAIVGIGAGLGFVVGALLLPVADIHPHAWRGMYAVGALGLLFLPSVSRNLHETKRFAALVARNVRGSVTEVVDRTYGGRFAITCVIGFLLYVFLAPQSQFTNRYLGDERGFSGTGILILRAATQAIPAFAAAYAGGRLAESRGRKPIARWGLIVGAAATAGFFLGGGPILWLMLAIGTVGTSLAGPSLSAFTTELFPTEVRGTAGAGLTIASVTGSAAGLLLVGYLAEPLGSVGRGIALTAIGPILVALFLVRYLPEAKGRLLDEVSPPEV